MPTSYDVRIWKIEKREGRKGKASYHVVWVVAGERRKKSHQSYALADSFRSELLSAVRRGEGFDTDTGLPVSQVRAKVRLPTWYELARGYVDMKWPRAAAKTRAATADALATVTAALVVDDAGDRPVSFARSMGPGCCHDLGTTLWLPEQLGVADCFRQAGVMTGRCRRR